MGNWNITIQGIGPHGNVSPKDADQLFKHFVRDLEMAGHNIIHSSITKGSAVFGEPTYGHYHQFKEETPKPQGTGTTASAQADKGNFKPKEREGEGKT